VEKDKKLRKEKILSQYDIIKLTNMGSKEARKELEERLKNASAIKTSSKKEPVPAIYGSERLGQLPTANRGGGL